MGSKTTQWAVIAVLVGMMAGPGALASPEPAPAPKAAPAPDIKVLDVKAGEIKRLEVKEMSRVAVGDPAIADVEVAGNSVLEVKGLSEGKTMVIVWTRFGEKHGYEVHVRK